MNDPEAPLYLFLVSVYVDAAEACNDLTFELGQQGIGTGIANRQWSIKVSKRFAGT